MKRLQLLIILFSLALAVPLGYLVVRTYQGLEREELAEWSYFAETVFDVMQEELAALVVREESRAIEDYNTSRPWAEENKETQDLGEARQRAAVSPLSKLPSESYILGYIQNNPDGSFQTPLQEGVQTVSNGRADTINDIMALLGAVNIALNLKSDLDVSPDMDWAPSPVSVEPKGGATPTPEPEPGPSKVAEQQESASVADKYIARSRSQQSSDYLGQEKKRVEQYTAETYNQALNLDQDQRRDSAEKQKKTEARTGDKELDVLAQAAPAAEDAEHEAAPPTSPAVEAPAPGALADTVTAPEKPVPEESAREESAQQDESRQEYRYPKNNEIAAQQDDGFKLEEGLASRETVADSATAPGEALDRKSNTELLEKDLADTAAGESDGTFQVEIDPLQSLIIDTDHVFIFRRIVVDSQVFRQGFVIQVEDFLSHLSEQHFAGQPMARFAKLRLAVLEDNHEAVVHVSGASSEAPKSTITRTFPRPFSFLRAELSCDAIPRSQSRSTLTLLVTALAAVMFMGLLAIHHSAGMLVDMSEKRSSFVSSVTHELKTPLTNIRMYIEMLEQGMARDPEREQEYFRIVGSETARLSRLINNVLEFSKLENKNRHIELTPGDLDEVLSEVQEIMREKIRQEGFTLTVQREDIPPFPYNSEILVQVLINLIENSLKFGKTAPEKHITLSIRKSGSTIYIEVSDTGPGIPRHALSKVFDDFYRVDSSLTRTTRGTGIGLALVRKLVAAMNGKVSATNNTPPPGCRITLAMPI